MKTIRLCGVEKLPRNKNSVAFKVAEKTVTFDLSASYQMPLIRISEGCVLFGISRALPEHVMYVQNSLFYYWHSHSISSSRSNKPSSFLLERWFMPYGRIKWQRLVYGILSSPELSRAMYRQRGTTEWMDKQRTCFS